jgi:excisionase family DNA binding protein
MEARANSVEDDMYLSVQDAAAYLGISRDAIHHRIRARKLEYVVDPLDKRRKLIKVKDLLTLKRPGRVLTVAELRALEA